MNTTVPVKVLIIQPVIPEYRLPFFRTLILNARFDITIFAGKSVSWGPVSCEESEEIADLRYEVCPLFGGKIFWQKNISIPEHYGPGDVLVLSGAPRLLSNLLLMIQARLKKMKIIWWGQGWTVGLKTWQLIFRQQMMKLVDVVILYTMKEVSEYVAAGFNNNRVFGINNTIGTLEIAEQRLKWNMKRLQEFKLSQGFSRPFRLLFVSRLKKKTFLSLAIAALEMLPKAQYELIVIGDGPELNSYQAEARSVGVEDRVSWLGAIYDEDLLAPYFLTASCFIYPGAIGLSLLHSFAYGLPVITHNNIRNHGPEFAALVDGVNGLTFEEGNSDSLASKISELCGNAALLRSMRENALECIKKDFSMGHMVKTFEQALHCAATI